jgi:hypothetical protein
MATSANAMVGPAPRSADRPSSVKITAIHDEHRELFDTPRIHRHLQAEGVLVGRKRVEYLMCEAGIRELQG